MNTPEPNGPAFDLHATTYDEDLNASLLVSGEDKNFFANGRVSWLARRLKELGENPFRILDYGCGTGDTTKLLQKTFAAKSVTGVDISLRSLEIATQRNGSETCQFMSFSDFAALQAVDLVYCNGVFHHVPLNMRDDAVEYIYGRIRPGGIFALWENNPWSPATRYVMSQCVFDRDAVTISPPKAEALLRKHGFEPIKTDYCFFFPRFLKVFRSLETKFTRIPLGAQYQVLCRRP